MNSSYQSDFTANIFYMFSAVIDCEWSEWQPIGTCSQTCGDGIQQMFREVKIWPKNGGKPCEGPEVNTTTCNNQKCPGKTLPSEVVVNIITVKSGEN